MTLQEKAKYVYNEGFEQIWQWMDCPKLVNDAFEAIQKANHRDDTFTIKHI